MYKYLFLMLIVFCGCKNAGDKLRAKQLQDTLAKLKLITDFKPLTQVDAYAFMNNYYLPHLDSLPFKRKLYTHPITGIDYKKMCETSLELSRRMGNKPFTSKALQAYVANCQKNLPWDI